MSEFIDDEASCSVASSSVASTSDVVIAGRGHGRVCGGVRPTGAGCRRRVAAAFGSRDLDKRGCYWLLTFYYAILNGELWEDDPANGHSKDDLNDIVSGLSEEVGKKMDYLVIGFEFCKADEPNQIEGRPHAHLYVEFMSRKSGHQVIFFSGVLSLPGVRFFTGSPGVLGSLDPGSPRLPGSPFPGVLVFVGVPFRESLF
jgi:hypothetical protein